MQKILIAYYSRRGENYLDGRIVNLPIGNTEVVAQKIERLTRGELFRIDTVKKYPTDYTECTRVAQKELRDGYRPRLADRVDDMTQYDTLFLGYPNWWGTMPMAVHAFLEAYPLGSKTVVPFCTHEGGGMGHSVADIRALCPFATVLDGAAFRGNEVGSADRVVEALIHQLEKQ